MTYSLNKNYNSLDRLGKWDEVSQKVVTERIEAETGKRSDFRYLTEEEGLALRRLIDALIPQDLVGEYVNIAIAIDRGLSDKKTGVRYGDSPWRGEFYRHGLRETEEYVLRNFLKNVKDMSGDELSLLCNHFLENGDFGFGHIFIKKLLSDAINVFYSHPSVWNRIGFPGPAYPEGYAYLDCGERDDWEPEFVNS